MVLRYTYSKVSLFFFYDSRKIPIGWSIMFLIFVGTAVNSFGPQTLTLLSLLVLMARVFFTDIILVFSVYSPNRE